jgi:hypothetical protein
LIVFGLVVLTVGNSQAGVGDSGFWFTGTGYYTFAKNAQSDKMIDGAGVAATLEGMRGTNVSLGLSLGYASMDGESSEEGVSTRRRVSSMPAYLLVRYWLGDAGESLRGYAGGAAGVYISFLDTTDLETTRQTTLGTSGLALAVPVGFVYSVGERMFLNVNYTLNWLVDNEFLDNGLTHVVGVGLGFSLSH